MNHLQATPKPPFKINITSGEELYRKLSSDNRVKQKGFIVSMCKTFEHTTVHLVYGNK